ncbi:MAG: hypothetical protein GY844_19375 [Bradyrhizobium sp.]|nr:hypothetical protein [Bradyrhizobium sp.]
MLKATSAICAAFAVLAWASPVAAQQNLPAKTDRTQATNTGVESIFLVRSIRTIRYGGPGGQGALPTDFCNSSRGFDNLGSDDFYTFSSIETDVNSGLMGDGEKKTVGSVRACFSTIVTAPDGSKSLKMWGLGELAGIRVEGPGACEVLSTVEPDVTPARCWFEMKALPNADGFTRALLTTNTVFSKNVFGNVTDPPGYAQSSIATVRLWRPRS